MVADLAISALIASVGAKAPNGGSSSGLSAAGGESTTCRAASKVTFKSAPDTLRAAAKCSLTPLLTPHRVVVLHQKNRGRRGPLPDWRGCRESR